MQRSPILQEQKTNSDFKLDKLVELKSTLLSGSVSDKPIVNSFHKDINWYNNNRDNPLHGDDDAHRISKTFNKDFNLNFESTPVNEADQIAAQVGVDLSEFLARCVKLKKAEETVCDIFTILPGSTAIARIQHRDKPQCRHPKNDNKLPQGSVEAIEVHQVPLD
ncbi:unnamed protein product [Protopolystoma xenopodis]|uniref:Uncharacterized protein n=1 Tax=Protopolystoma xenopodis TaxID=117903 RepID=A0A3S5AY38_9PLAT|nr:unnamed protein product [Protopolystoma xenopodis]